MRTTKTRLAVGVASVAIVTGLGTPAFAACTVDGSTVTCTADSFERLNRSATGWSSVAFAGPS